MMHTDVEVFSLTNFSMKIKISASKFCLYTTSPPNGLVNLSCHETIANGFVVMKVSCDLYDRSLVAGRNFVKNWPDYQWC